jgi:hypothetical protein
MKKIKYKSFYHFIAGQDHSKNIYCNLKKSALNYKYRDFQGQYIAMTEKDLAANPVLEFKESDKIQISPTRKIDGKKLRELFVATIFVTYLDSLHSYDDFEIKGKNIFVGYTEKDTGTDVVIFITDGIKVNGPEGAYFAIDGNSTLTFHIQVKEYFSYEQFQSLITYPKDFDIKNLNVNKLKSYNELILIYVRTFTRIDFQKIKADLKTKELSKNHIILIGTEAGEELPKEYTFWDFKKDSVFKSPIPICNLFHFE